MSNFVALTANTETQFIKYKFKNQIETGLLLLHHCSLWTCDPHTMYNFLGGPHKGRSDLSDETKHQEGRKY